ncbi:MAG: hypothetical protein GY842_17235, partial [bacterium]|nr:hypothetical protein [bacterium]
MMLQLLFHTPLSLLCVGVGQGDLEQPWIVENSEYFFLYNEDCSARCSKS